MPPSQISDATVASFLGRGKQHRRQEEVCLTQAEPLPRRILRHAGSPTDSFFAALAPLADSSAELSLCPSSLVQDGLYRPGEMLSRSATTTTPRWSSKCAVADADSPKMGSPALSSSTVDSSCRSTADTEAGARTALASVDIVLGGDSEDEPESSSPLSLNDALLPPAPRAVVLRLQDQLAGPVGPPEGPQQPQLFSSREAVVLRLDDAIIEPTLGSAELPTSGSRAHRWGTCKPCVFIFKEGCLSGVDCRFCHLCKLGEKKKRRKERKVRQQMGMGWWWPPLSQQAGLGLGVGS